MKQLGENGHEEYSWSKNIRELIVQINYQLVRSVDLSILKGKLSQVLHLLKNSTHELNSLLDEIYCEKESRKLAAIGMYIGERNELLIVLYKMIGYTRDVVYGKGEYLLTYMMILVWYSYFPECAKYALKCCVDKEGYGSWKDVKYFCNYCLENTKNENHPMIEYAIFLANEQLQKDYDKFLTGERNEISLVAKWIPRENSKKFGWLFQKLAVDFYSKFFKNGTMSTRSINKASMEYRKMCSSINNFLETVQIKQCSHRWSEIEYNKITSGTLLKQSRAFLNLNKNNETFDRAVCAARFYKNIILENLVDKNKPSTTICPGDFVKRAFYPEKLAPAEKDVLNFQWRNQENMDLVDVLPILDMYLANHNDDSCYAAIGLACKVAESSSLGKRILAFGIGEPFWIDLTKETTLVEMITCIKKNCCGITGHKPNFYSALEMIINSVSLNMMNNEDIEKIKLMIFSDFQIEPMVIENGKLYDVIKEKYEKMGTSIHKEHCSPPSIIFWNLRCTNGFPCFYNDKNVSMISGYSTSPLKAFLPNKNNPSFNFGCTNNAWGNMKFYLDNSRYKKMQDFIMENQEM